MGCAGEVDRMLLDVAKKEAIADNWTQRRINAWNTYIVKNSSDVT